MAVEGTVESPYYNPDPEIGPALQSFVDDLLYTIEMAHRDAFIDRDSILAELAKLTARAENGWYDPEVNEDPLGA